MDFTVWGLVLVGVFCLVRAGFDLRAKRYAWAALGFASGLLILLTPIPTQAVKIDLPVAAGH